MGELTFAVPQLPLPPVMYLLRRWTSKVGSTHDAFPEAAVWGHFSRFALCIQVNLTTAFYFDEIYHTFSEIYHACSEIHHTI